ncbi:condensation domain-containing protein [Actinomadura logoneensis]|nr:condensation domain-containing protein [Actinomadura logoneensis]
MTAGGTLPDGISIATILSGLGALVERHESLRTLFRLTDDGTLVQEVVAEGEVDVGFVDLAALGPEETVGDWSPFCAEAPHDPATMIPFGARIGMLDGRPVFFQLWMSHLAADFISGRILADELVHLLEGGLDHPPGLAPVDVAEEERSPRGRRALARGLEHWRRELAAAPPRMFPAARHKPQTPRYWRGGIRSQALPTALTVLAERYRAGPTHVMLAATAVLLGRHTGVDRCAVRLMAGNRVSPALRHAVGNLAQEVLTVIDLSGDTFGEVVRNTWAASLRVQRNGRFDADDVAALTAGSDVDLAIAFNDLWTPVRDPGLPGPEAPLPTTFHWERKRDRATVTFFLEVHEDLSDTSVIRLSLLADTAHLPPPTIRAFLFGIERLLLSLVDGDLRLAEIEPIERPPAEP